ncbi:hypothetical protein [Kitasatospora griseola]|uniref:hypothetical protein n=1 Tax=Kitasatospora griseola TaxID=2064 RepID=UPI00364B8159
MSDLTWHVVTDLCLTAAIVPDSNNASSSLKDPNNVTVADAMVHIAPEPAAGASGTEVTVAPTSTVG